MIHFGQAHDHKYGNETVESISEKSVGTMELGFAFCERIRNFN
jgi:hypothetical protein